MEILLKVEKLKKYFPVKRASILQKRNFIRAVDGVSFDIRRGETIGLVGESGSGKSTIGRLIARLITPNEGNIYFEALNITTLSRKQLRPLRKKIQIIFQDPYSSLNPRMRIHKIVSEGLERNDRLTSGERRELALDIIAKVGLRPEYSMRYPHEFSGGQRQRIAIARTIVLNPELVVADEPLSALDVSIQAQVINLLVRLKEEYHLSYLLISHDLSVVKHLCDRVAVMYLGKIVEFGTKKQVYDDPSHPYTITLLSAVPVPKVGGKKHRIILKGDIPNPINPPSGCRFHTRCFKAMKICSQIKPAWKDLGNGHFVLCHL